MTIEDYEDYVSRTYSHDLMEVALGIGGEAGEVQEWIKKYYLHHRSDQTRSMLVEELGDVLFHVCAIAINQHVSLQEIMSVNIEKLKIRYPNGWVPGGGIR